MVQRDRIIEIARYWPASGGVPIFDIGVGEHAVALSLSAMADNPAGGARLISLDIALG